MSSISLFASRWRKEAVSLGATAAGGGGGPGRTVAQSVAGLLNDAVFLDGVVCTFSRCGFAGLFVEAAS